MMAAELSRSQIAAMDETMAFDAGHHAQAYAKANLHHVEDVCGVVKAPASREQLLIGRIATRQNLLARSPMHESLRQRLTDANDLDEQELSLLTAERYAEPVAAEIGRVLFWCAVGLLYLIGVIHLAAMNWRA